MSAGHEPAGDFDRSTGYRRLDGGRKDDSPATAASERMKPGRPVAGRRFEAPTPRTGSRRARLFVFDRDPAEDTRADHQQDRARPDPCVASVRPGSESARCPDGRHQEESDHDQRHPPGHAARTETDSPRQSDGESNDRGRPAQPSATRSGGCVETTPIQEGGLVVRLRGSGLRGRGLRGGGFGAGGLRGSKVGRGRIRGSLLVGR